MKVIFLDIDGVLNGHDWDEGAQSNRIQYCYVKNFNKVLAGSNAKIVISSAWRYMVHGGDVTCRGFEYLLRTHGACGIVNRIIGVTCRDEDTPGNFHPAWSHPLCGGTTYEPRTWQIRKWLQDHPEAESFVAIDDMTLDGIEHRQVLTDGCGMTEADADKALKLLGDGWVYRRPEQLQLGGAII